MAKDISGERRALKEEVAWYQAVDHSKSAYLASARLWVHSPGLGRKTRREIPENKIK